MASAQYVKIAIPVEYRAKDYEKVRIYRMDDAVEELKGFMLSFPKRMISEETEVKSENNGKICDYLVCKEGGSVKFTKRTVTVNATVEELKGICGRLISAPTKAERKKTVERDGNAKEKQFKKLYIPSELRANDYENVTSYLLDERFGEFSGFYITAPIKMVGRAEKRKIYGQERIVDKIVVRNGHTFTLKRQGREQRITVDEFAEVCKKVFTSKAASVALGNENNVAATVGGEVGELSEEERAAVKSSLEEGIFSDASSDRQIVKNEYNGKYMIVANADMEIRENELFLTDEYQIAVENDIRDGKDVFFDTVERAKLTMFGAEESLPETIKAEDAKEIDRLYKALILDFDGDEIGVPSKKEYAESFVRQKEWAVYQNYENDRAYEKTIPYSLREKPIFVGWKFEYYDRAGNPLKKPAKVPYNPNTGGRAMATEPGTWAKFDLTCQSVEKYGFDGIGVMMGRDKVLAIDIDHCIENGKINDMAKDVIETVNSYTELSPSGNGIHILAYGEIPASKKYSDIEIYNEKRFITLTGHTYEGKLRLMKSAEVTKPGIDAVWEKYIVPHLSAVPLTEKSVSIPATSEQTFDDAQILRKIEHSDRTREKFERLKQGLPPFEWDDERGQYKNTINKCWYREDGSIDASRVENAFCKILVYFNATPEQVDRIYRACPLARNKWDERRGATTYGQLMIANAYGSTTKRYNVISVKKNENLMISDPSEME